MRIEVLDINLFVIAYYTIILFIYLKFRNSHYLTAEMLRLIKMKIFEERANYYALTFHFYHYKKIKLYINNCLTKYRIHTQILI